MTRLVLPDALYYLRNFQQAIQWVVERNHDLLSDTERRFATLFSALSIPAQALLARLSMRRGVLFRYSKIRYAEIQPLTEAFDGLVELAWLDSRPPLTLQELFRLTTRAELEQRFGSVIRHRTKQAAYEALIEQHVEARSFADWVDTHEPVYRVLIAPVVLQFRLLHFGNFYQEWHEYTLTHLQIFKYEPIPLDSDSRPFESREEIEFFYALYRCYEAANDGAELPQLVASLPEAPREQGWLRRRWDRLRFHLGQAAERQDEPETALQMYRDNTQPEACVRHVRLLECLKRNEEALTTARALLGGSSSELIVQRVNRIATRLERRGGVRRTKRINSVVWPSSHLQLSYDPERCVEELVQEHLTTVDAPVYYMENSLICSLFGLLCWDAIFQPVRGAFFHPFQSGPADLGCPDFVARRRAAFHACLQRLDTGDYAERILMTFSKKYGTSAPFVHWHALDESTLRLALLCIPVEHLKLYFARLLDDPVENATGFADLVQFFLPTRAYKLIEVKGPRDRLQDNQQRWLHYCARHDLPMEVCRVSWG